MTASPQVILERQKSDRWSGIVLALLILAAVGLVGQRIYRIATGPKPPGPGVVAPSFSGLTVDKKPLSLEAYRGKVVLIDFWATWCPPCVAALPHLQKMHEELGDQGFVVLGVNQEPGEEPKVKRFMERVGVSFPSVMDPGAIHTRYAVYSFPTTFVVDRQGTIVATFRGPAPEADIRRAVDAALAKDPS